MKCELHKKLAYQRGLQIAREVSPFLAGLLGDKLPWIQFNVWEPVTTSERHAGLASTIDLEIG